MVTASLHKNLKNRFKMIEVDQNKYDFSKGYSKTLLGEAQFKVENAKDQINKYQMIMI
jgi:hypothetical protein